MNFGNMFYESFPVEHRSTLEIHLVLLWLRLCSKLYHIKTSRAGFFELPWGELCFCIYVPFMFVFLFSAVSFREISGETFRKQ